MMIAQESLELPRGPRLSAAETTFRWLARPYELLDECAGEFGDTFTLQFARFGTHVIVSHPDDIRAVFAGEREVLFAGRGNALLEPVLGKHSLLLVDGERHVEQRAMLQPAFASGRVHAAAQTVVDATRRWTAAWKPGDTVSLQRTALEISKEVILRTVMNPSASDLASLGELIHQVMQLVGTNATFDDSGTDARLLERFRSLRQKINDALQEQIEQRRGAGEQGNDLLAILLAQRTAKGVPLSDEEIRDQLLTMILAGHETTASSITWAMLCLHGDAEALQSVRGELAAAVADTSLAGLPFLQAACFETLRLRPVIPVVSRQLQRDFPLRHGTLPAGVFVNPCAYLAHRRVEYFPDPDAFRPQRFVDRRFPAHVYFPFGGGARRCIGMSFAMMELQIVTGMLTRMFDFAEPPAVRPVRRAVTIVASAGGKMRVQRRREA